MTVYTKLWDEIYGRLRAAFFLMKADSPTTANEITAHFQEYLDQNEFELALDELLSGMNETSDTLRRRIWEESLTAAMLMGLELQFHHIVERINELEPYIFDLNSESPRVYCDFNGFIQPDIYSLDGVGTALDFARLRQLPKPGQHIILYDADANEDGTPSWLLADAQIVELESYGLVAKVTPKSYRWEPRQEVI